VLLWVVSCATKPQTLLLPSVPGPAASVTRDEVLAIAGAYSRMEWQPAAHHAFHGLDSKGIRVDTPDAGFRLLGKTGWWKPGRVEMGMPYKWGGFDTPASFQAGLTAGKYAGDIHSAQKRRLLDAAVSEQAAGIDCSGFISRCWRLDRAYSTREMGQLTEPIGWDELRPGDILNAYNRHVVMFVSWDADGKNLHTFEAGTFPDWKVGPKRIPIKLLKDQNFQPLRYRQIRDTPPPRVAENPTRAMEE
jgi:hypothetical protein